LRRHAGRDSVARSTSTSHAPEVPSSGLAFPPGPGDRRREPRSRQRDEQFADGDGVLDLRDAGPPWPRLARPDAACAGAVEPEAAGRADVPGLREVAGAVQLAHPPA
jgi:hypothetical protein